ncbi:MAG: hypothetical protein ABSE22_08675 [Xanthobacteraceae bacterium]
MPEELLAWLPLVAKLILTAGIVVTASIVAERVGALTGALIATLPVTIWPAYVFLSLNHDTAYVAEAARSGLVINAFTGLFLLLYATLAQKRGTVLSLTLSVASWITLAGFARSVGWKLESAVLLNFFIYPVCLWLSSSMRAVNMPQIKHAWYDLPTRTFMVCALMTAIIEAGNWAGPVLTGILAVYPISSTSLILILQPRIGGRAAAAVLASSLWSLFGIGFSLIAINLLIVPLGAAIALSAALAIPLVWNLTVWIVHRHIASAVN